MKVKIGDLIAGGQVRSRAFVVQRKTGRPVQFELLIPPVEASSLGMNAAAVSFMISCFRVELIMPLTSARGSMLGLWASG